MKTYPPGTLIGQYEIAGHPLMGGMGIVYLCLDTETDRPVVLKTFRPELLPDRQARDRFLREGTAWVDLGAHPHVVRCYRVLHTDPEVYLVLELIAKEQGRDDASLRAWLTLDHPLPVEQALLFALQIARGMKHATDVIPGFVHRDLKPENVLVGADHLSNAKRLSRAAINRLRVTDFGLAAVLESASERVSESAMRDTEHAIRNTQLTHGIVGTPLYMAPEQWRGKPVTTATDVYALGCILYEMLAGERAVSGHSLTALQRAHCAGQVRPSPDGLPAAVSEIVTRCLAVEPGERYGDWGQVEAALAAAYEDLAGRPAPQPEPVALVSRAERVAAGWSYSEMGVSYLDLGKAQVAAGYFERAREVGSAEGERQLEGAALGNLGIAYKDLGDSRRAIGYHEQCLTILREIGDRRGEGAALGGLGLAYAALGDARRAIGYHEQHLAIAREIGDRRGEGNVLGNLGNACVQLGDARRAIGYHEQHLAIAREIGDRRGEGAALGNLGNAYADLGDARRAIGYYERQLVITREIGDRRGEGNALGNLGNAYAGLGDTRRAIDYLEQALAISREVGDKNTEAKSLGGLGQNHRRIGDPVQGLSFSVQALAVFRELGDRLSEGRELSFQGHTYFAMKDHHNAVLCWWESLQVAEEIGDLSIAGNNSFMLAQVLAGHGDREQALELAQKAFKIYSQVGRPDWAEDAQRLVVRLRGGEPPSRGVTPTSGPSPAEILRQFTPIIEAVAAAAQGHRQARAAVEAAFDQFERGGWRIVDPIQRIWAGERDEAALTAGIDSNSALIVREILKQLGT